METKFSLTCQKSEISEHHQEFLILEESPFLNLYLVIIIKLFICRARSVYKIIVSKIIWIKFQTISAFSITTSSIGLSPAPVWTFAILSTTAKQNKQKFLNKTTKVFINKKIGENLFEGRDINYNVILINSDNKFILGKNKEVRIRQVGVHHMRAELI